MDLKALIEQLDAKRRAARPDVARELSIAITHLEDAAHRIALARIREPLHLADAEAAIRKAAPTIVGVLPEPEQEEAGTDGSDGTK